MAIEETTISDSSSSGAAIYASTSIVKIVMCNITRLLGPAFKFEDCQVSLTECSVSQCKDQGSLICESTNPAGLNISTCTFSDCDSIYISYDSQSKVSLTNCKFFMMKKQADYGCLNILADSNENIVLCAALLTCVMVES